MLKRIPPQIWIVAAYATVFGIPLVMLLSPPEAILHAQSFCPMKMISGMPCPGCGVSKSLYFLFRGEWRESFALHAFGPAIALFMAALPFSGKLSAKMGPKWRRATEAAGYVILGLFMVYYLARLVVFVTSHTPAEVLVESIWK